MLAQTAEWREEIGRTTDLLLQEIWGRRVHTLDALCVLRREGSDDRRAVAPECHECLQVSLEQRRGLVPGSYDIILVDSD